MRVLEKMSLKKTWGKLCSIKELLICVFQICWNNRHLGNFSSFRTSARRCCSLLGFGGWKGKFRMHTVTALPVLQPCPKSELCQAEAGSGLWHSVCHVPQDRAQLCQVLWVLFAGSVRCCTAVMLSSPCVQDQGRLWGTARVWGLFSQSYYKFLQCEPLMFSKTQAERTC